MPKRIEYKFVRLGEGLIWFRSYALGEYRHVIQEHAREGWRLVQVFSPSMGLWGVSKFIELIFERESEA